MAGQAKALPAREVFGPQALWFEWMANNLHHLDPETLTLLINNVATAAIGYEMDMLLPAITCPVLLLQTDPVAGARMTDDEVVQAVGLLARPTHMQLAGVGNPLHATHATVVLDALRSLLEPLRTTETKTEQTGLLYIPAC